MVSIKAPVACKFHLEGSKLERQESMDKFFKELNIPVEYFIAKRHPRGGRVGCFDSHYQVCKLAKERNYNKILIFEDDVVITPAYSETKIANIIEFMKNNIWESIQFGYGPQFDGESIFPVSFSELFRSERMSANIINFHGTVTHAYALSDIGISKVLKNAPIEIAKDYVEHYDLWLFNNILDTKLEFAVVPLLFDQNWCFHTTNKYEKMGELLSRQLSM